MEITIGAMQEGLELLPATVRTLCAAVIDAS